MRRTTAALLQVAALAAGTMLSPPPAAAEGVVHRVVIEAFAFVPDRIEVRPGDRVEWVNRDLAPHTATAGDGGWDTGHLGKWAVGEVIFPVAGGFDYVCAYHPHMRGEVVVVAD